MDIVPLVTRSTGLAFWVPLPGTRGARGEGFVVISDNLPGDDYWLPAGVYMDHWTLREGIQAPPPGRLLSLPGVSWTWRTSCVNRPRRGDRGQPSRNLLIAVQVRSG